MEWWHSGPGKALLMIILLDAHNGIFSFPFGVLNEIGSLNCYAKCQFKRGCVGSTPDEVTVGRVHHSMVAMTESSQDRVGLATQDIGLRLRWGP